MRVIADLCLIPIGIGVSVSKEIAACEVVLAEAGLKTKLHAYGTNIEGEWDAVFAAIKRCHEVVHALGAPRISSSLRFGTRTDRSQNHTIAYIPIIEKGIVTLKKPLAATFSISQLRARSASTPVTCETAASGSGLERSHPARAAR